VGNGAPLRRAHHPSASVILYGGHASLCRIPPPRAALSGNRFAKSMWL
jgi:hypothetical protein